MLSRQIPNNVENWTTPRHYPKWRVTVEGRKEMFYLTTHSTHFIYGYIWLRTILIVRKETRCRHIGYSFRLTARVLLYAPSHRQDSTYHGLCYTSRGALAGTRNRSLGSVTVEHISCTLLSDHTVFTVYVGDDIGYEQGLI